MNAQQLQIEFKNIDIKFLEEIIRKIFLEKYDDITKYEAERIYKIVKDKEEE